MAELDTIVDISIDAQTTSPAQAGFGIPLFVGFHTKWTTTLTRLYSSLAGMLADGFTTSDSLYKMAKAAFAQNPRPPFVMIGRLTAPSTMTVNMVPIVAINSRTYSVIINGVTISIVSDASATSAEIVAALVTAINGSSVAAAVTASGTVTLAIIADVPGTVFTVEVPEADLSLWTFQNVTTDGSGIAAALAAISVENDTWYALGMDSLGKAEILAAAAYIETVKKIAVFLTNDSDVAVAGSGDVASALVALSYKRSALMYVRQKVSEYANAAWLGKMLPSNPGSATWKFKTLAGVSVDSFTDTQRGQLKTKRANRYEAVAAIPITAEGVVSSGEFVDVTVFLDWLRSRMQERLFGILANNPKVPMSDPGLNLIESGIRGQLLEGASTAFGGIDASTIQVVVPRAAAISSVDRALRKATGITWQARLTGAVHSVTIVGTVTV